MFTKYNKEINIPQNYSGNRFREQIEDTKTNIHRASTQPISVGNTKTSVSPSFQDAIEKKMAEITDNEEDTTKEAEALEENEAIIEKQEVASEKSKDAPKDTPLSPLKVSGIGQLLENIGTDDVLLIALIVLLSSDKDGNGLDAIIILALLLLYH